MNNQQIMGELLAMARGNVAAGGWPFACIITQDGHVLAAAVNQVQESYDPSGHAEILAIRQACKKLETTDLSGCEMYVVGKPCPMCLSCSIMAGVTVIHYAVDVADKDRALSKLPLTDSLYRAVADEYGARVVEYRQAPEFAADGIAVFEDWNGKG